MTYVRPTLLALLAVAALVANPVAQAADKAALKCRKTLAKQGFGITKTALKALDRCHAKRDRGRSSADCNVLNPSSGALGRTVSRICAGAPDVLALFDGGPATAIPGAVKEAIEASGRSLQGAPSLAGDKAKAKCHKAIGAARSRIVLAVAQGGVRCQNALDKQAAQLGELASQCAVGAGQAGGSAPGAITRACGALAGADVGSCDPLPSCVVDGASDTGHTLAARYYASRSDPRCGDGNVDAGLGEECDEGTDFPTDTCVGCKLAGCGDGHVATAEQCDDGNRTPGDGCSDGCQVEGTPVTVVIALTHEPAVTGDVAGVSITVDYPTAKVGIPGSGNVEAAGGRVANLGPPDVLFSVSDRDADVDGADDQLFIPYGGTVGLPKGDIVRVIFDGQPGATVAPGEFTCTVVDAVDVQAQPVTGVTCAVTQATVGG